MNINTVYGQGVKLSFGGLTLKVIKKSSPIKVNRQAIFDRYQRDHSESKSCLLTGVVGRNEKRKLIELYEMNGYVRTTNQPKAIMLSLVKFGFIFIYHSQRLNCKVYKLTKRGKSYAQRYINDRF